ncbi:MAG TPA: homocysteine S-methyltransferase family protein [Ornithinimicrobium sp.]|uniref:homocysteine S-methyltransferase family protein n=1 Tax=Ornithinimicrobium sp. TaxID=1977084 RepID=UPI002B4806D6|nr:homocysteine S-methyltransferase family protein [Ornithinimicrobium sp.]HKJ12497.1 homocysteine S-methyltransferase family protein [Ornithinimicrobium sp.]
MTHELPHLAPDAPLFLTDGGIETDLIFNHGADLPEFAAFPLVENDSGRTALTRYFQDYLRIAQRDGRGIILETPTWRANPDWGSVLGYSAEGLAQANRSAVRFVRGLTPPGVTVLVSGNVGPRGDGYVSDTSMSAEEAAAYHHPQVDALADAGADMVTALTMTYAGEAAGVVMAAQRADVPVVIAFTVETDGRLPSGQSLAEAINEVDEQTGGPAYYMVNCAHPSHFVDVLRESGPWERVRAVRANASRASHAELDEATELDRGDPAELAEDYRELATVLPALAVVGGCCGTDAEHVSRMSGVLT